MTLDTKASTKTALFNQMQVKQYFQTFLLFVLTVVLLNAQDTLTSVFSFLTFCGTSKVQEPKGFFVNVSFELREYHEQIRKIRALLAVLNRNVNAIPVNHSVSKTTEAHLQYISESCGDLVQDGITNPKKPTCQVRCCSHVRSFPLFSYAFVY